MTDLFSKIGDSESFLGPAILYDPIKFNVSFFANDRDHFDRLKAKHIRTAARRDQPGEIRLDEPNYPGFLQDWLFIFQAAPHFHIGFHFWHGNHPAHGWDAPYLPIKSDTELAVIVQHCLAKGGFDPIEREQAEAAHRKYELIRSGILDGWGNTR